MNAFETAIRFYSQAQIGCDHFSLQIRFHSDRRTRRLQLIPTKNIWNANRWIFFFCSSELWQRRTISIDIRLFELRLWLFGSMHESIVIREIPLISIHIKWVFNLINLLYIYSSKWSEALPGLDSCSRMKMKNQKLKIIGIAHLWWRTANFSPRSCQISREPRVRLSHD